MSTVLTVIYTLLIFGVIIFVHELGHFIAARICKVKVNEFSIGMGPTLFKHQGKNTKYSLRLLPVGGYCAMEGEDDESEDEHSFSKQNVPKRIFICVAGAVMNLLLGLILIFSLTVTKQTIGSTTVALFNDNATSSESGLQIGDQIVKINNTTIFTDRDIVFELLRDTDAEVSMVVKRNGEKIKIDSIKFKTTGEGENKQLDLDFKVKGLKNNVWISFVQSYKETFSLARNSIVSVGDLITGKIGLDGLSGPVGVGKVVGEAAKIGFASIINIAAFIAISIGIANLLPFPALDGGRILLLIIEAIRRKPINKKYEAYINTAGLVLLFLLMIVVTFKDVFTIFK